MKKYYTSPSGFTMIELIVVIAVVIVLSGLMLAGYFGFSRRQAAADDARTFVAELRKVQSMARNLVYPEDCVGLRYYKVTPTCVGVGCKSVEVVANCTSGGDADGNIVVYGSDEVMQNGYFTDQSFVSITFMAGTGNISPSGTYAIFSSDNSAYNVYVNLNQNGNIDSYVEDETPQTVTDLITPIPTSSVTPTPTPTATLTPILTLTPEIIPTETVTPIPTISGIIIDGGDFLQRECPLGQTCSYVSSEACIALGGTLFQCSSGNCCSGGVVY